VRPAGAPGPRSRPNLQMALYGANRSLVFEPTENLLDAHLSSLTTISALTFSVAILSFFMPRLKSRVVNCREFVNCRELLQSSAQRRSQCWRDERNCLPPKAVHYSHAGRRECPRTPMVGCDWGGTQGPHAQALRRMREQLVKFRTAQIIGLRGIAHGVRRGDAAGPSRDQASNCT
jgi:hypothetical protein